MTEFIADASKLAKVLKDVKSVVKPRQTMAILSHVMIDARDGVVTVTATDLDIAITRTVEAEVADAGTFTVEASRFTDVVGSYADGAQVKLSDADGTLMVTSGRSRCKFPTLPATDFPPMPFGDPITSIEATADFLRSLQATRHAHAPSDIARYYLIGSFMGNRSGLEICGTDSDRLSRQRPGIDAPDMPDIIVPSEMVDQMLKLPPGFAFEVAKDKVRCTFSSGLIVGKLVDSQYPDYARVIPDAGTIAKVDGDELASALNRIALLSGDKERTVNLSFEADKLTVRSRAGSTVEEGVEEMPCAMNGEPINIAFRSQFLRDALGALDADEIEIMLLGPRSPTKITSLSRPTMTLVVMPLIS